MAWQRKIPFGYMIEGGVTQPHPREADAVRYIFGQYLAGASLLAIAEDMTRQGIRYHQHTAEWNGWCPTGTSPPPSASGPAGIPMPHCLMKYVPSWARPSALSAAAD